MQAESKHPTEGKGKGTGRLLLWKRMQYARWLLFSAGILSFLGFVLVALGISDTYAAGTIVMKVLVSPLVVWGIALIGLGVMLGFFGAAVKGPSREWSDVAPPHPVEAGGTSRPPGFRYACPGCGGDVYTGQTACPECGHSLPGSRASRG